MKEYDPMYNIRVVPGEHGSQVFIDGRFQITELIDILKHYYENGLDEAIIEGDSLFLLEEDYE